jgi:orotate phosphoribosyltransferase
MAKSLVRQLHTLGVIKKGSFILKSGKKSDLYIDIRKAYGSPKILDTIAKLIIKKIPKNTTCIACSGYGGLPLGAIISNKTSIKLTLVRDSAKKHGDSKVIEGYVPTKDDYVVIVDDIFSSGTGIKTIVKHLKSTKVKILKSIVVVKRGKNTLRHPLDYIATEEQLR